MTLLLEGGDLFTKFADLFEDVVERPLQSLMLLEESANEFGRHVRFADSVMHAVLCVARITRASFR